MFIRNDRALENRLSGRRVSPMLHRSRQEMSCRSRLAAASFPDPMGVFFLSACDSGRFDCFLRKDGLVCGLK